MVSKEMREQLVHLRAPWAMNWRLLSPSGLFSFWSYHLKNSTVAWKPWIITWYQYQGALAAALNCSVVTLPSGIAAGSAAAVMPATQIAWAEMLGCQLWQPVCPAALTLWALPHLHSRLFLWKHPGTLTCSPQNCCGPYLSSSSQSSSVVSCSGSPCCK